MTYYVSLYVGVKRLVFHLSPRDSHVIIVSGCQILTAVNLIVLIRMAYITKRLVELCKIYCNIWHRLTWSVCTGGRAGGRAGVRYVITKFSQMDSLPNFLTHGAPLCARFARARSSAMRWKPFQYKARNQCVAPAIFYFSIHCQLFKIIIHVQNNVLNVRIKWKNNLKHLSYIWTFYKTKYRSMIDLTVGGQKS